MWILVPFLGRATSDNLFEQDMDVMMVDKTLGIRYMMVDKMKKTCRKREYMMVHKTLVLTNNQHNCVSTIYIIIYPVLKLTNNIPSVDKTQGITSTKNCG